MIQTNIRIGKYSNIFEYPNIRHTLFHKTFLDNRFNEDIKAILKSTVLLVGGCFNLHGNTLTAMPAYLHPLVQPPRV